MPRPRLVAGSLALLSACLGPNPRIAEQEFAAQAEGEDAEDEGCANDELEPNDGAEIAAMLSWDELSSWNEDMFHDAVVSVDAYLCPGEHDWYLVPISELGFDDHVLRVDGLVLGTSWCGQLDGCPGASLGEAPEHSLAVEIYDADSRVLLSGDIAANGRVDIDAWGPSFARDLLIHVYGPTAAASYEYALHVDVRSYAGEDECEC